MGLLTNNGLSGSSGGGKVTLAGAETLSNKTLAGYTLTAPVVTAETVVSGTEVDVTKPISSKAISDSTVTLTFSATPSTGTSFMLIVRNTDTSDHTITLPSVFSEAQGASVTAFSVGAESALTLAIRREASRYVVYGDAVSDVPAQVSGGEITAGTETALRSYSPANIVAFIDEHGTAAPVSDAAFGAGWNGDTTSAPSKNAVFDMVDTDEALTANSDSLIPSQQAVKAYVDANAVALPMGTYVLWPTADLGTIPSGFLEADGTEGTEDLSANAIGPLSFIVRSNGLAPYILSAEILADGVTLEVVFSRAVSGDGSNFILTPTGDAVTLSSATGTGTDTWQWSLSRTFLTSEDNPELDYSPGNMTGDNAMALAAIENQLVTNNSTQVGGSPTPSWVGHASTAINSGTTSPTISYPTVTANDIMLMAVATDTLHTTSGTPPTGWTKIHEIDLASSDASMSTFWKRAGSSEPSSEAWTSIFDANETGVAVVFAIRGCTTSGSPFDVTNAEGSTGANASHSIDITTTVNNCRVVAVFGMDPQADPSTFSWNSPITKRVDGDTSPTGQNALLGWIGVGEREVETAGAVTMGGTLQNSPYPAVCEAAYAFKA
jgi:hypothetical protein